MTFLAPSSVRAFFSVTCASHVPAVLTNSRAIHPASLLGEFVIFLSSPRPDLSLSRSFVSTEKPTALLRLCNRVFQRRLDPLPISAAENAAPIVWVVQFGADNAI